MRSFAWTLLLTVALLGCDDEEGALRNRLSGLEAQLGQCENALSDQIFAVELCRRSVAVEEEALDEERAALDLVRAGLVAELGPDPAEAGTEPPGIVWITLELDRVFLGSGPVSLAELEQRLRELVREQPQLIVAIQSAPLVRSRQMSKVFRRVHAAGITRVRLVDGVELDGAGERASQ